jgi:hypothetical protein
MENRKGATNYLRQPSSWGVPLSRRWKGDQFGPVLARQGRDAKSKARSKSDLSIRAEIRLISNKT